MQIVRRFFKTKESAVILMFTGLFLVTSIIAPSFLSYAQLINLFRTISLSLLPAMGMVFVMTCGSIDLSAGSVLAFSGMLCGYTMVCELESCSGNTFTSGKLVHWWVWSMVS